MIVHHSSRLHERVTNGASDEFESELFQLLAHGVGLRRARGDFFEGGPAILDRLSADKLPQVFVE